MSILGSSERPLRVCIVGSGPSGFYAAETLLKSDYKVVVDMVDRLPAPYGLVRYGVAPDHQKIKNVIKIYEKIAAHKSFSFLGNVEIGEDLSVKELQSYYDAIIFACGSQSDRKLGIPGEDLEGSYPSAEFVAWYNGHPQYRNHRFDLAKEVAVVIGQGNVAMDVARILCKTVDELKSTDITQYALDVFSKSQIRVVHLIGRRGPVQASFTPSEVKEIGELHDCDVIVDPKDLELNPESQSELNDSHPSPRKKNFEILLGYSKRPLSNKKRKLIIHFLKGPKEIKGKDHIEKIVLEKNKLIGPPGEQRAVGTGVMEEISCGIVFRSVGYLGTPIMGVPFDDKKGIIPNLAGRVIDQGNILNGLYAVGWIKRGAVGVIGSNKPDSDETVASLLSDLSTIHPCPQPDTQALFNQLKNKGIGVISFWEWQKISAAEVQRGQALGKPREKFVLFEEMLEVLKKIA